MCLLFWKDRTARPNGRTDRLMVSGDGGRDTNCIPQRDAYCVVVIHYIYIRAEGHRSRAGLIGEAEESAWTLEHVFFADSAWTQARLFFTGNGMNDHEQAQVCFLSFGPTWPRWVETRPHVGSQFFFDNQQNLPKQHVSDACGVVVTYNPPKVMPGVRFSVCVFFRELSYRPLFCMFPISHSYLPL